MELIIDSFAGGGGASTGIEMALGRSPDVAINHDPEAIAMHAANHPETLHLSNNIWKVNPDDVRPGEPIGLLWASPDCTHHSKAKGGVPIRPEGRNSRDLGWIVVLWAQRRRPRVIILENVEEWKDWAPLIVDANGDLRPDPERKGATFKKWVRELKSLGYRIDWKELRACDYGAPTIRKRLYVIARCDGAPIRWPAQTHGAPDSEGVTSGRLRAWRTAAECIDWTLPCPSIFDTAEIIKEKFGVRAKRPLADATMARIAKGVMRYVVKAAKPFIVPITHKGDLRTNSIDEPLRTQTTAHRGEHAVVSPTIVSVANSKTTGRGPGTWPADDPLRTVTKSPGHAVVTPFVTKFRQNSVGHAIDEPLHTVTAHHSDKHPAGAAPLGVVAPYLVPRYMEREGQEPRTRSVELPAATLVPGGNGGVLATAHLMTMRNAQKPHNEADKPLHTLTAGGASPAVVAAFLAQHNTGVVGHEVEEPVSTLSTKGAQQQFVAASLINMKGSERQCYGADEPVKTLCAQANHAAAVYAFLAKYYGTAIGQEAAEPLHTATTKPRHGLVTVTIGGEPYVIVDIGMRMLTPRERFLAQGFPPNYVIDLQHNGKRLSGEAQGRMVGNSVCPPVAAALVAANCADLAIACEAAE